MRRTELSLRYSLIFRYLLLALIFQCFMSCENDMQQVRKVRSGENIAVMTGRDIHVEFSDSGFVEAVLTGPVVRVYEGDDPQTEFPEGFHVKFFDKNQQVQSELSARYGINHQLSKIMEAKGDVLVINHEKQQQLNTEQLTWNQLTRSIQSDAFVKVTTKSQVLYGKGMTADESLDKIRIGTVSGHMSVKQDSL
ncbi:MAG: LPS export ABC transporter periplasmic protein LptC [Bacteroidetes bacterium]|nr:LPS export ABC transporter periplasmic protein LptC [Bacteroidota bacterium]